MLIKVENIKVLWDRQQALNDQWLGALEALVKTHDEIVLEDVIMKVLDEFSAGIVCGICMCPVLYVQNLSTGDKMAVCRNFYSAIKLASVVVPEHTYTDSLCVNCLRYVPGW